METPPDNRKVLPDDALDCFASETSSSSPVGYRHREDETFKTLPDTDKKLLDDALDGFAAETSSSPRVGYHNRSVSAVDAPTNNSRPMSTMSHAGFRKGMRAASDVAALCLLSFLRALKWFCRATTVFALSFGSFLATRIRDYLVQNPKALVGAVSVGCIVLAVVTVEHMVDGSETVSTSAVSATSLPLPGKQANEAVDRGSSNRANAKGRLSPVQARATSGEVRRTAAGERRRFDGSINRSAIVTPATAAPSTPAAAQSQPSRTETVLTPEPVPANDGTVVSLDRFVYSDQDRDVQPPTMLSSELPRPTYALWATRTNAMELIVSEDGAVERVRLLTPPQRMPDMMLLSRAKMWKFGPAVRDGRPVRYRVVLTWDVNP